MGMTVIQLADRLRTEADAYRYVEELRWPDGIAVCPHCGNGGATYIEPRNGKSRATRTGTQSQRRVWRCSAKACRKQFSAITGTCMHGTKVPIRVWIMCFFEMVSSKNGVAAREIERKYGVCCRTAWHLMHRIREAMKNDSGLLRSMRGEIVADETFIGGLYENRPKSFRTTPRAYRPGEHINNDKSCVLSLINTTTGEARSAVIPDVTGASLAKVIREQVDMAGSTLMTDAAKTYELIGREFIRHDSVNHKNDEWARYEGDRVITSNAAENFFSQLKRSIDGTHHRVSREHLFRYLGEFDYRYSTRKMSDTARMAKLMGQVEGARLTYKRVKAS